MYNVFIAFVIYKNVFLTLSIESTTMFLTVMCTKYSGFFKSAESVQYYKILIIIM